MLSRKIFFAALALALLASAALTFDPPASRAQDRRVQLPPPGPPPTVVLESDAESVTLCEGDPAPRVNLRANARSPEGRELRYRWSTRGGRTGSAAADAGW